MNCILSPKNADLCRSELYGTFLVLQISFGFRLTVIHLPCGNNRNLRFKSKILARSQLHELRTCMSIYEIW
jgi:hypothetical protein